MSNTKPEPSMLETLVGETWGVIGAAQGTTRAELRAVIGSTAEGDASLAVAAKLTGEMGAIGALLGLGPLDVVSLKAATGARVFARQAGQVLAMALDPKCQLGELEARLRTLAWAPREVTEVTVEPLIHRAPTAPIKERAERTARADSATKPPPFPASLLAHGAPASTGPVFTGDLEVFGLPQLLEFLRTTQRTGLLMCTTHSGIGTIQLSRGMIVGAHSPNALDLRKHFLTNPEVAPERRQALAALPAECFGDDKIEGVLVARELMPRGEVERARVARIYSVIREMIRWTVGRFSFDPGVTAAANPAPALSAQSILMQLYQEQDEHDR
jgi:predicted regulator of Ras-like GTPase activity (Roadblock/LC7/MglB family)